MSEFDEYLERLRLALDLSRSRADEICAEARSHLEARAAQLQETGLSADDAAAEAVRGFGDVGKLAAELRRVNRRHRGFSALRALLALGLVLGVMAALVGAEVDHLGAFRGARGWVESRTPLSDSEAWYVLLALLAAPPAMLAGMMVAPRHWWVAAAAPLLWGLAQWTTDALDGGGLEVLTNRASITWPLGGAALLGAFSRAGSLIATQRRQRGAAWAVAGSYVALVIAFSLNGQFTDAVARWGALAALGAGLSVIAFALYRDSRPGKLHAWAAGILCAIAAGVVIVLAFVPMFLPAQPGWTVTWRNVALTETAVGVAALASFWGRRITVAKGIPLPAFVAIALVLGGALVPASGAVRSRTRQTICVSNIRELIRAFAMYAADNDGSLLPRLPEGRQYTEVEEAYLVSSYAPYAADADLWHCPSQPRARTPEEGRAWQRTGRVNSAGLDNPYHHTYRYAWKARADAAREFRGRPLLLDMALQDYWLIGAADAGPAVAPHGPLRHSYLNVGYLDGYVESLTTQEWWRRIDEEGRAGLRGTWGRPPSERTE
jgi:hypothetical protein